MRKTRSPYRLFRVGEMPTSRIEAFSDGVFAIVCVWWVAHHHLFALLAKSDRGLLWLNILFLFWLASGPFQLLSWATIPASALP